MDLIILHPFLDGDSRSKTGVQLEQHWPRRNFECVPRNVWPTFIDDVLISRDPLYHWFHRIHIAELKNVDHHDDLIVEEMLDAESSTFQVGIRQVRDSRNVMNTINERSYFRGRQIPVRILDLDEVEERDSYLPVFNGWWIRVEGK